MTKLVFITKGHGALHTDGPADGWTYRVLMRFGNTDQPIAMRSLWGWSLIGLTAKRQSEDQQPPNSFALLNIERTSIRDEVNSLKAQDFEEKLDLDEKFNLS